MGVENMNNAYDTDDKKEDFLSQYDESLEKMLPAELLDRYQIKECLNSADSCDTLLVVSKDTGRKFVAKCYEKESTYYYLTEPEQLVTAENDAIPHFEVEYCNENYRCVLREYIEGCSLYDYVKTHKLTDEEIADLAIKLAEAMKILHNMKPPVIHRDIKPQNIIIRNDGSIALIDLGISRVYRQKETDEDTVFCGTHFFAPPEQYGFMQTDIRSDIYSFGIVLSWLLTGKARPIRNSHTMLARIAAKCCEFSPDKRYKNDDLIIMQLKGAVSGRAGSSKYVHKRIGIAAVLLMAVLISGGIGYMLSRAMEPGNKAVKFKEPMIEQAVRTMLDQPSGKITVSDLENITEIYIHGVRIAASEDEFYRFVYDGALHDVYGEISDLADLEKMPNLRNICIGANRISDISALRNLSELEHVEFRDNDIEDISALENKEKLYFVGFNHNKLNSIEALATCDILTNLDLRVAGSFDGRPLESIEKLQLLDIACDSDAYRYLDHKDIVTLKLGAPEQTDLECIRNINRLEELYIYYSQITDISALEGREDITYLNMTACMIEDISPVFTMPNLQKLVISENSRDALEIYAAQNSVDYEFEVEVTE